MAEGRHELLEGGAQQDRAAGDPGVGGTGGESHRWGYGEDNPSVLLAENGRHLKYDLSLAPVRVADYIVALLGQALTKKSVCGWLGGFCFQLLHFLIKFDKKYDN